MGNARVLTETSEQFTNTKRKRGRPPKPVTINLGIMDWELLRKQKQDLCFAIEYMEADLAKSTILRPKRKLQIKHAVEALNGMLHLIDHIQDEAVDTLGIPSKKVFGRKL